MSFWKRDPEPLDNQGWELHPCTPPSGRSIYVRGITFDAVIDNVWVCQCGRRWRCTELEMREALMEDGTHANWPYATYQEDLEFTEQDYALLLEFED